MMRAAEPLRPEALIHGLEQSAMAEMHEFDPPPDLGLAQEKRRCGGLRRGHALA